MASIVNNKKYGEGHEVVLKAADKMPAKYKTLFMKNGYKPGTSVFKLTFDPKKVDKIIDAAGNIVVHLKDQSNKVIKLIGSKSAIENSFNHTTSGKTKSNTNLLTEIKENVSMWLFEGYFERGKILTEEEITTKLGNNANSYDTSYYESAKKQLEELKKYVKSGGYTYERQGQNKTATLYTRARKLTGKANDNWNPADVWMIRKGFDLKTIYNTNSAEDLNGSLARAFYERDVIPISLKNVTTPKAKSNIVDPNDLLDSKLDLNLKFDQVDLSDTFNNYILKTKSGFAVRAGFKASSTTLNVSLEGRMIGAGYQLGGIDAKDYKSFIKTKYGYTLRSGAATSSDVERAKTEIKTLFNKYNRLSNTIKDYSEIEEILSSSNEFIKSRFSNIVSYLYAMTYLTRREFEDHMQYCYFSAKKITKLGGVYLILQ
jgi:hypothetical protein